MSSARIVVDVGSDNDEEELTPPLPPVPGVHRPPPPVNDGSGDPNRLYYIPPPDPGMIGPRWVVWCGIQPGIYNSWPAAKSQIDAISFATHQKFKHPRIAWEEYEAARRSNLVHRLPYYPPLVPDSGAPDPLPIRSGPFPHTSRRREEHEDQQGPQATSSNPIPPEWAGTWPTSAPATLTSPTPSSPPSQRRLPPSTLQDKGTSRSTSSLTPSAVRPPRTPTSTARSPVIRPTSPSSLLDSHGPSSSSQTTTRSIRLTSQMVPSQWIVDVEDPWHGLARSFVVFSGTVPGICRTWEECRWYTRRCIGPVYRGYARSRDATAAWVTAMVEGRVQVLDAVGTV